MQRYVLELGKRLSFETNGRRVYAICQLPHRSENADSMIDAYVGFVQRLRRTRDARRRPIADEHPGDAAPDTSGETSPD